MIKISIFRNLLRLRALLKITRRPIFIFQMGKVGSSSAFSAIQKSLEAERGSGVASEFDRSKYILFHSHRVSELRFLYRSMILWRIRLGLPLKVVVPIREPIARNVSAFFFYYYRSMLIQSRGSRRYLNISIKDLATLFLMDSRPATPSYLLQDIHKHLVISNDSLCISEHQFTLNWFDKHFKPLTRIDVYKKPFPVDRKWQIYNRGSIRVLLYRVDLKRSEQAKLISGFLGIKLDEIEDKRSTIKIGMRKQVKGYSQFCESVKLPEQYIERMHSSRFAQHFWSPQELNAAADKWRGASGS